MLTPSLWQLRDPRFRALLRRAHQSGRVTTQERTERLRAHWLVAGSCAICGTPLPYRSGKRKYCSRPCHAQAKRARHRAKTNQ